MDRGSVPVSKRTRLQVNRSYQEYSQSRRKKISRVAVEESTNSSVDTTVKRRRAKRYSRSGIKFESRSSEDSCSVNIVKEDKSVARINRNGVEDQSGGGVEFLLVNQKGNASRFDMNEMGFQNQDVGLVEISDSDDGGCEIGGFTTGVKQEEGNARFGSQLGEETSREMNDVPADVPVQGMCSSLGSPVHVQYISSDSENEKCPSNVQGSVDVNQSESGRKSSLAPTIKDSEKSDSDNSSGEVFRPKKSIFPISLTSEKSVSSIATKALDTKEDERTVDSNINENPAGKLKRKKRSLTVKKSQSRKEDEMDDGSTVKVKRRYTRKADRLPTSTPKKTKIKGKKVKKPIDPGTVDHLLPVPVSDDEQVNNDVNGEEEEVEPNDPNSAHDSTGGGSWKGMTWMPLKKRHKFFDAISDVNKNLEECDLWDQIDLPDNDLVPHGNGEADKQEFPVLPKNFGLKDLDEKPAEEKSYWDIVGEELFEEMDFVLATGEIGWTHSNGVDTTDNQTPSAIEYGYPRLCKNGEHFLILNEQIGIICKFCSYVELEIKYIPPTFVKNPWGRITKKEMREAKLIDLDRLQMNEKNNDNHEDGSHSKADEDLEVAGTVWSLIPGMRRNMYTHQRDGFEFIWNNIQGSIDIDELKKQTSFSGNGCIISHAPGTGKTRLTIMFIQSFLEFYPSSKILIIAPCSMLLTWEEEFKKWKVQIPFHNLNKPEFSGQESDRAVNIVRQARGQDKESTRFIKLLSWKKDKSVLGISYKLFEQLAGDRVFFGNSSSENKKKPLQHSDGIRVMNMLQQLPGLLVMDEGHTPRNENSLIWKALSRIETRKRIILSGTPFQNNFRELYNTLCLVRPEFADKFVDKEHGKSRKTTLDEWYSLTRSFTKKDEYSVDKLRDIIYKMAHVYKGNILKDSLPGLRDSVVVLKPLELQTAIVQLILANKNGLEREHCVSLISVHPSLLLDCQLCERPELAAYKPQLEALKLNPQAGVKTKFVIELIRLSQALKERVLVFSQYTHPLAMIKDQLKSSFGWSDNGKEIMYMDGGMEVKQRQVSISSFNDSSSGVKVMLASTKACSEGISLVGASRVVLLDVVWNPSVERQAISRAYRIGQKKLVYIYHLIAGEMESCKYDRQTQKDRLSELVFTSKEDDIVEGHELSTATEDIILQEMVQHKNTCHMFEKIINQKEESLIDTFG